MKKNDKFIILLVLGILFTIMTWLVATGSYSAGEFSSSGISRAGIFDYMLIIFYSIYYKASDIFYLLIIGGVYGVLSQTKNYRKLVSSAVKKIKGKEIQAMLIITFIMSAIVSISTQILPMLMFVPFIITIFLKRGKDRLTALNAGFGGIFIGLIGLTFGTYGMKQWMSNLETSVMDGIIPKIIIFVLAYIFYNLFAIIHMKKQKEIVNEVSYDMFATNALTEEEKKKNKKLKTWPMILIFSIVGIIATLAYINWNTSFDISFFDNIYADLESIKIKDVPFLMNILGSFNAFGQWDDLLPMSCILLIGSIITALINKVKISEYIDNFATGLKKMSKVVFMYLMAMTMFIFCYYFNWPITLLNSLFPSNLNIFILFIIAIIATLFYVDNEFIGFNIGSYVAKNYADNLIGVSLIMQVGYGLSCLLVPSSAILMIALSYLDISYTKWLKYIWKFLLIMLIIAIITSAIVIYV